MATKTKILNAYENIILNQNDRAATLENIAKEAGISKGGLLYHYISKEAINTALLNRLQTLVQKDIQKMKTAKEGPAAYFLKASAKANTQLDRTLLATIRLGQISHQGAKKILQETQLHWLTTLQETIKNPTIAQTILLIGDGLYYNAALTNNYENLQTKNSKEQKQTITNLIKLVEKLIENN